MCYRDLTPVANAAHSVTQLHHMLEECKPEPSSYIMGLCDAICIENLQQKITALSSKFLKAFDLVCIHDILYHAVLISIDMIRASCILLKCIPFNCVQTN